MRNSCADADGESALSGAQRGKRGSVSRKSVPMPSASTRQRFLPARGGAAGSGAHRHGGRAPAQQIEGAQHAAAQPPHHPHSCEIPAPEIEPSARQLHRRRAQVLAPAAARRRRGEGRRERTGTGQTRCSRNPGPLAPPSLSCTSRPCRSAGMSPGWARTGQSSGPT